MHELVKLSDMKTKFTPAVHVDYVGLIWLPNVSAFVFIVDELKLGVLVCQLIDQWNNGTTWIAHNKTVAPSNDLSRRR